MGSVLSSEYEAQEEEESAANANSDSGEMMPSRDSSAHSSFETLDRVGGRDEEDGDEEEAKEVD